MVPHSYLLFHAIFISFIMFSAVGLVTFLNLLKDSQSTFHIYSLFSALVTLFPITMSSMDMCTTIMQLSYLDTTRSDQAMLSAVGICLKRQSYFYKASNIVLISISGFLILWAPFMPGTWISILLCIFILAIHRDYRKRWVREITDHFKVRSEATPMDK